MQLMSESWLRSAQSRSKNVAKPLLVLAIVFALAGVWSYRPDCEMG
jgi:hypothetical protein